MAGRMIQTSSLASGLQRLCLLLLLWVAGVLSQGSSPPLLPPQPESSFVNCASYSSAIQNDFSGYSSAVQTSTKDGYNSSTTHSAPIASRAAGVTPLTYEEYYCLWEEFAFANTPDSFPNNNSLVHDFDGLAGTAKEQCMSLQKANYSSWIATASYPPYTDIATRASDAWKPFVSPPCCNTFCDLSASPVRLLFWPTPAPSPHITTLVSDGYTFTSPSAYLIYSNLSAGGGNAACNKVQWPTTESALTVAYAPNDVSSFGYQNEFAPPTKVDYANLWSNCTSRAESATTSTKCNGNTDNSPSCQSYHSSLIAQEKVDYERCYFYLAYPGGLQEIHPEWARCNTQQNGGAWAAAYDPPRALAPVDAMAGATPVQNDPAIVATAAAAPIAVPPDPSQTPAPITSAAPNGAGNDPASQAPANPQPVDPAQASSSPPAPNSGDPTPANAGSANDPAKPNAADPGASDTSSSPGPQPAGSPAADPAKASGIPFVIPIQNQGGSQNQPAAPAAQAPAPQASADPAGSNPQNGGQQQPPSQPASNTQGSAPASGGEPAVAVPAPAPAFQSTTIAGHGIAAAPSSPSALLVDGQTISHGGSSVQIAGTPVAWQSNGDLVLGSSTVPSFYTPPANPTPAQAPAPQVVSAAGQPASILPSNGGVVIAGSTLVPNAAAISISGTPVSLGPGGLVVGSSTITLPSPAVAAAAAGGGTSATLLPNGNVNIGGTTITPNAAAVTVAGTPVSLGSSGVMVVGSSTITVPSSSFGQGQGQALPSAITAGGSALPVSQLSSGGGVVVGGTTLQVGTTATISGTPVALQSGALVVGSSTIPYGAGSSSIGVGGFVNSALNGGFPSKTTLSNGTVATATGSVQAYAGKGGRVVVQRWAVLGGVMGIGATFIWL